MTKIKFPFHLLTFIILILIASCAINPVTGKRELMLISEQGELSLGQETDQAVRAQFGVYNDPTLTEYLTKIGNTLVPHTHRPHLNYHFAVLDSPVANAFAAPGGYIYFTRGILALMNSEAEMAVILGHELGHVNARHSVKKLSQLYLAQIGLAVGSALSEEFAEISGAASIGIQLLFLKFSRDDEREADALGVEYSRKGKYNPAAMIDFFNSLQALGDLSNGHSLPGFLSTHPLTSERIRDTSGMITEADNQLLSKPEVYLDRVDNLVYGDDPRQGYVEGSTFYHPLMRFYFSIPQGWELQNTPTQVILASEDGNAAVLLQAEKNSESLKTYAQKKAESIEGRDFISDQNLTINGMSAYQQVVDISQQESDTLRARLSYIRKNEYIFSFTALSTILDFKNYDFQFGTVIGSFNELRERAFLNRQPKRLKIIKANGRENLKQIFQKAGIDKELWPKFAIMNAMKLDSVPGRGRSLKITK